MIAVRLILPDEFDGFFKPFGCKLVEEKKNDPEPGFGWRYYKTAWNYHFYVPGMGPDNGCPESRFFAILSDLSARAPRN